VKVGYITSSLKISVHLKPDGSSTSEKRWNSAHKRLEKVDGNGNKHATTNWVHWSPEQST